MRNKMERTKKETTFYPVLFMRIAALLACLTLISLYLLSGAYSKFYTTVSGGDGARVALFAPYFNSVGSIDVSNATLGYTEEITFTVQNFSNEKVPEVAMKYTIILKTTGNIPLKFTVCKSDGSIPKDFICDGTSGEQIYEYTDSSLVFNAGVKKSHAYKLKAEWQSDQNDARFSGMTDAVYLEVEFEQID